MEEIIDRYRVIWGKLQYNPDIESGWISQSGRITPSIVLFKGKTLKNSYRSIVVLTGAGISAESGIRTFRAADGLWEDHRVEDVATPEAFTANPTLVHHFYNSRRRHLLQDNIAPNLAHKALAAFESQHAGSFTLITQNIDDLHERAGSKSLIHMHGELRKQRCNKSGKVFHWDEEATIESICPCCNEAGNLRPHVVWFGEMPLEMDTIYQVLSECDLFMAIGTSGNVYPAAGFVQIVHQSGARTVELNLDASAISPLFSEHIVGKATETVPQFLASLSR